MIQKKHCGFGLLEVLISIIILSIGLLGIAAMQVVGMKNVHSSYLRSQASLLAYEFADILRSNVTQVQANKFGDSADDGVDINTGNLGFNITANCINTTGCTPDKMAETDLGLWAMNVNAALPSGIATVARNGNIYTVTISWLDDLSDADAAGVDVNGDGDATDVLNITDDVDNDGADDVVVAGNEANFKQLIMSFEP